MSFQTIATGRLRNYDALQAAAENLPARMAALPAEARPALEGRLEQIRSELCQLETALGVLTPEQRLVLELMDIRRDRGNPALLCQLLNCEQATVYRRRRKALDRFTTALYG